MYQCTTAEYRTSDSARGYQVVMLPFDVKILRLSAVNAYVLSAYRICILWIPLISSDDIMSPKKCFLAFPTWNVGHLMPFVQLLFFSNMGPIRRVPGACTRPTLAANGMHGCIWSINPSATAKGTLPNLPNFNMEPNKWCSNGIPYSRVSFSGSILNIDVKLWESIRTSQLHEAK